MKITLLGSGRWASNLAGLCLQNGHSVLIYEKLFNSQAESEFYLTGKNAYLDLSSYKKNNRLFFTHDIDCAIEYSEYIIISILSQKLNEFMQEVKTAKDYQKKHYCLAMKGVEENTGRTLSEILTDNGIDKNNIVALAGPGHVQSINAGKKTHMVIAGYNAPLAYCFKDVLCNESFRLFFNEDLKGVELCGAAKNVYGAMAGICVGAENATLRGSLMCASLAEMERYLEAMQCNLKTARRLPLLGDYDATMYDLNSHNLNYGIEIVKQNTITPNLAFVSIEGKQSVSGLLKRKSVYSQHDKSNPVPTPLLSAYEDIVKGEIAPEYALNHIEQAIQEIYKIDT